MRRMLAVAVVVAAALISAPVSAQTDSPIDDLFGDDEDAEGGILDTASSVLQQAFGFVTGARNRVSRWVSTATGLSDPIDASTAADDLQAVGNDHAAQVQAYANDRVNASTSYDVFEIEFRIDGDTATRYVTADVVNGSYENASVDASTDRPVDESCTLEGAAARNAADELESFVENYVEPDRDVDRRLFSEIAAEYGGSIGCTFL